MPRFVFEDQAEFKRWIDGHVTRDRYECYISKEHEVIFVPIKSTRPVKYGYMKFPSSKETKEIQKTVEANGVKVYNATTEWDPLKAVGTHFLRLE